MITCTHLDQISDVTPAANGCGLPFRGRRLGSSAPVYELRIVGCCDSSPNKHASAHTRATDHPIVESFEPTEDWFWCYVDEVAFLLDDVTTLSYASGPTDESGV